MGQTRTRVPTSDMVRTPTQHSNSFTGSQMPLNIHILWQYTSAWWIPMVESIPHLSQPKPRWLRSNKSVSLVWNSAELNFFAQLLHRESLNFLKDIFAWMDSTIVLNWIISNSRRFKIYVGNRARCIVDLVPSNHWHHVEGSKNPADCASRGLLPSELLTHDLWWNGSSWLKRGIQDWPVPHNAPLNEPSVAADLFTRFSRIRSICSC